MRGRDVLDWLAEWEEGFLSVEDSWRVEISGPGSIGQVQRPNVTESLHASADQMKKLSRAIKLFVYARCDRPELWRVTRFPWWRIVLIPCIAVAGLV